MARYIVWHAPNILGASSPHQQRNFNEFYNPVAYVEADNLGEVFELTNNIDKPWHENDGVKLLAPTPCRSTSVGDVIQDLSAGEAYAVAPVGFKDLSKFK